MIRMTLSFNHVTEVDPPTQVGWYYNYWQTDGDPLISTMTEEVGPYPTVEEARASEWECRPHNWEVREHK
jgi:hypothetical protein